MKRIIIILTLLLYSALSQATVYSISTQANFNALSGITLVAGDQVLFERGKTFYGSFTIANSGALNNRIVYGAYGTGANPIITGFTTVSSWNNLGGNIWESTSAVSTLSTVNVVSISGVNTAMGRTPNTGVFYTFQSHSGSTSITSSNLTGTPNWTGAEAVMRIGHFKLDRRIITSQSGATINWAANTSYAPVDNSGFFFQNDVRTLDQQNEWYYDTTTKKIKVYSVGQPTNVRVSSIDDLVTVNASYLTIEDIDFQGANNKAITTASTTIRQHITIRNCNFNFTGAAAIQAVRCSNYLIDGNTVNNSNTNAIGSGASYINAYNVVISNNTIQNTGVLVGMAQSTLWSALSLTKGAKAEYNRVINSAYHGISFYGDSVTIKNNFIDSFCMLLDDGGAIYTFTGDGQSLTTKSVINGNICINGIGAASTASTSDGFPIIAAGIYMDYKTNDVEIYNNTTKNTAEYGIFLNGNTNINVHNNTFYDASAYQIRMAAWGSVIYTLNSNKFISKTIGGKSLFINSGTDNIPSKVVANNNYYASPIGATDLFYVSQPNQFGDPNKTISEWKTFSSQDANSLGSPKTITDTNDLQFYYNDTKADKVVFVPQPSIDMEGVTYSGNVTLAPFTSLVLIANTDYYVSTTGNNTNDGLTPATAWATIPYACSQVSQPYSTINILNGTHTIATACDLSVGVSLIGESKIGTIVNSTVSTVNVKTLNLVSTTLADGNQEISNLTLNGNFIGEWAMYIENRSNVKIHDIVLTTFDQRGIWFINGASVLPTTWAAGNEVYNCTISDNAKAEGGGQYGNLCYGGQDGFKIYNNTITANGRTSGQNGVPIKFAGTGQNKNTQIYNNTITAPIYVNSLWDFALELWAELGGTVIHDNYINGSIDLVRCEPTQTGTFGVKVYNNTIGRETTQSQIEKGIYLEYNTSDIYIYNNLVRNVTVGVYVPRYQDTYLRNIHIYYNIFSGIGNTGTDYYTFGIYWPNFSSNTTGYEMHVYNNIFEAKQGLGRQIMYAIGLPGITNFTGFYAKNNICTGWQRGAFAQYATSATVDHVEIKNNLFYNNGYNNDANFQSGWVPTNYTYSGTIKLNPLLNSDYSPTSESPTINAGLGVGLSKDYLWKFINGIPDVGSIEYFGKYSGRSWGSNKYEWKF